MLILLFAALTATLAILLPAQSAQATTPGDDGAIVFVRQTQSGSTRIHNIWKVDPVTKVETQLTDTGSDRFPSWCPDGQTVVFGSSRLSAFILDIYKMDENGAGETRVTTTPGAKQNPSCTADGASVLYNVANSGTQEDAIYRADLSTGAETLVVDSPDSDEHPAQSPDGNRLAWSQNFREFNGGIWNSRARLMVAGPNGENPVVLLEYSNTSANDVVMGFETEWHPDSSRVEWRVNHHNVSHHLRVTTAGVIERDDSAADMSRVPSPEGDRLAIARRTFGTASHAIYATDLTIASPVRLTNLSDAPGILDYEHSWQRREPLPADTTDPTITITSPVSGEVTQGDTVTADFSCADNVAVQACTATYDGAPVADGDNLPTTTVGDHVFVVQATDTSGNTAEKQVTFNVVAPAPTDTTKPVVNITSPTAKYVHQNTVLKAGFNCEDETGGSGIDTCTATLDGDAITNGGTTSTANLATHTLVVTGQDKAGNETKVTKVFQVVWPFSGFTGPVDNPPVFNTMKGGSTVPVQFSLGDDRGLGILAALYPQSLKINCNSQSPTDTVEQTDSPGSSGLSYDAATDLYSYKWKTDKSWKGTCRALNFKFTDGAIYTAYFQFK